MSAADRERLHLRVHGRVQGVYYRYHARERALGLGLSGWVRNRRDGTVELLVEGPRPALEAMLEWAERGSPAARVERVEARWEPADPPLEEESFHVLPTA